jgi:hypothetical protein
MLAFFSGLGAKLALGAVKAKAAWGDLDPVWKKRILIALAALALFFLHQWYAHRQIAAAYAEGKTAGYQQRKAEDDKAFAAFTKKAEAVTATMNKVTEEVRQHHDQDLRNNAARADAIVVRGAGKARCRQLEAPAVPVSSGGHDGAAPGHVDADMDSMPPDGGSELIAMPLDGAAGFAREHDDYASEVIAWRTWYPRMVEQWNKLREPLAKPSK